MQCYSLIHGVHSNVVNCPNNKIIAFSLVEESIQDLVYILLYLEHILSFVF